MKYEICKVVFKDEKKLYVTIAWTDVYTNAKEITEAMYMATGDTYTVLMDGEPVKDTQDAMRRSR